MGISVYATLQSNEKERRFHIHNRRTRTAYSDVRKLVVGRIARLKNDWITARFTQDCKRWGSDLTTRLGCFRRVCMQYEDEVLSTKPGTDPHTEDPDLTDLYRLAGDVTKADRDTEASDSRAREF